MGAVYATVPAMHRAMRVGLVLPLLLSVAHADPAPVIGGGNAPAGKWPDVAAVRDGQNEQFCTGTLIAPTVVITAQHCIDASVKNVLLGATSLARPQDGEVIQVTKAVGYPDGFNSFDIGIIVLSQPSTITPRPIASGWASLEIKNGAMAPIVGFGAIDRDSERYIDELQEAVVPITDADCSESSGCNAAAKPAGELGAGGMGRDTCAGDSGGPLYITSAMGTYLAGVTSRGYDNNMYYCSEGGIYERPDKVLPWIEQTAGVPVLHGPDPKFDPLSAPRGGGAETQIEANDPQSDEHTFAITTPPQAGTAKLREDGRLRVCTDPNAAGDDKVIVTITDKKDLSRALLVVLPITIENATASEDCNLDDFSEDGGCCSSSRSAGGSLPLGAFVLGALLRRRRRA